MKCVRRLVNDADCDCRNRSLDTLREVVYTPHGRVSRDLRTKGFLMKQHCFQVGFVLLAVALLGGTAYAEMTKNEFRANVRQGMTKPQVKQAVGPPDDTTEMKLDHHWTYYKKVQDEDSGKLTWARVYFEHDPTNPQFGTVTRVSF